MEKIFTDGGNITSESRSLSATLRSLLELVYLEREYSCMDFNANWLFGSAGEMKENTPKWPDAFLSERKEEKVTPGSEECYRISRKREYLTTKNYADWITVSPGEMNVWGPAILANTPKWPDVLLSERKEEKVTPGSEEWQAIFGDCVEYTEEMNPHISRAKPRYIPPIGSEYFHKKKYKLVLKEIKKTAYRFKLRRYISKRDNTPLTGGTNIY